MAHLICDGWLEPPRLSAAELRTWLLSMPALVEMARISPPIVEEPEPGLLVGMCLLAESHISAHLDYRTWQGHADVFSCKPLPALDFMRRLIEEGLRLRIVLFGTIPRGLDWLPPPGPVAMPLAEPARPEPASGVREYGEWDL